MYNALRDLSAVQQLELFIQRGLALQLKAKKALELVPAVATSGLECQSTRAGVSPANRESTPLVSSPTASRISLR